MSGSIYRKYMWLVNTVRQHNGITFQEISERWIRSSLNDGDVLSKRTFRNWLNAIGTTLGIDIECTDRPPYKYRIANNGDLKDDLMQWAMNAFSIGQIASENTMLNARILLDDIPSADWRLDIILSAMRNNHRLRIIYRAFHREDKELVTEPYAVKLSRKRWYAVCHSDKHNGEFIYAIDRIVHVEETDQTFAVREGYSAETQFEGCIGITAFNGISTTNVQLKITGFLRDYIHTLPLHPSQQLVEKTDDYTIYRYRLRPDNELIDTITGLGSCCEVLAPAQLRDKVRESALAIAELYR